MANQLKSGTLDTLKTGQTLLTKVIKTQKDGMVQIEIAEKVANPNAKSSLGEGFQTMYSFANGNTGGSPRRFWNPIEKTYHLYVTNLKVSAKIIYPLYRLRWQIELFFKASKTSLALKDMPSSNKNIIQSMMLLTIASCKSLIMPP